MRKVDSSEVKVRCLYLISFSDLLKVGFFHVLKKINVNLNEINYVFIIASRATCSPLAASWTSLTSSQCLLLVIDALSVNPGYKCSGNYVTVTR